VTTIPVLRVLLTMDCERVPASEFYPSGPRSWDESERNIAAFAASVSRRGFVATYFAVPEAVEAHTGLFKQLQREGHEVGLHLHPHTFRYGVNEYLGNLPIDRQRALLGEARDSFAAALGTPPTSFRPGHFSARRDTFGVLSQLGFKRTSAVIPDRVRPGTGSDWRGWARRCQYVDDIFEAPLTVHEMSAGAVAWYRARHLAALARHGCAVDALRGAARLARRGSGGGSQTVDLRIEEGSRGLLNAIVDGAVPRQLAAGSMPMIAALTHSYINFSARGDAGAGDHGMSRLAHLEGMLTRLTGRRDCTVQPTTLAALHRDYDTAAAYAVTGSSANAG